MSGRMSILFYSCLCGIVIFCYSSSGGAQDAANAKKDLTVSEENQTSVALTVYNNDLGLVKDVRKVSLLTGIHQVLFMDVASGVQPTSVHVKSLTAPDGFYLLEQNYEYDLVNYNKLMDKYVGKQVKLVFKSQLNGEEEEREAVLLSNNDNNPVYKIGDSIQLGFPGRVILPKLPENLLAKPTLVWLIDNQGPQEQELEVSYLTGGISWKCDYVLVLSKDDSTADLTGWVTIDNRSGATYRDAAIKLVAGEVTRVQPRYDMGATMMAEAPVAREKKQFEEAGFFEYHLYTLQRKTTIKQNQIKQIGLMEASGVSLTKTFIIKGQEYFYASLYRDPIKTIPVEVTLEFKNSAENHLGMPLPQGIIRVYKADQDGMLQFVGENSIKHTPKDEKIELKIGEAFDIKAERNQLSWRKIRSDLYEVEWEIIVRNHKDTDITVIDEENLPGDWEIIESTVAYEKISSRTVRFKIPVKVNGENSLKYKVHVKY